MTEATAARPVREYKRPFLTPWRREALTGYAFAMPWIFGFLTLTLGPMLFSLYASFTSYNITTPPHWIGLGNYSFIFLQDPRFRISLYNTVYYVIVKTPVVIVVSLGLAMLLNMNLPGQRIFRTIYYLPTVITGVAAIFLWVWILNPEGLLNRALGLFGIRGPNWFYDPAWAKGGLVVMGLWYIGGPILIFLAGLNGIPSHLYEAAEIDGAGTWAKFWNVTIPLLSPTIFYLVVTNIIGAFQVFNSAYVVSQTAGSNPGDPAQSLLFYEVYLFIRAFKGSMEMGFACALAWILFVIILIVTGIQLWLSSRWVYYES